MAVHGPDFHFLRQIPLLQGLGDREIDTLIPRLRKRAFTAGQEIFSQGERVDELYILELGRVEVFKSDPAGRRLTLWFVGPRQPFCMANLMAGEAFATAVAVQDSLAFCLDRETVEGLLEDNAPITRAFVGCVASRLMDYSRVVEELGFKSVTQRLASLLLRGQGCPSLCDPTHLTQSDLAAMLGSRREVVSRAIKRLAAEGLIAVERQGRHAFIRILDPKGLDRLARGVS